MSTASASSRSCGGGGRGGRPTATVHHRYQWLWLVAIVHPAMGASHWYILPRIRADAFGLALAEFARAVGAGPARSGSLRPARC
jgi:hypothetical protein